MNHKKWLNGKETLETLDNLAWQSAFTSMDSEELSMPGNTFSVRQLNHYIHYLQETGQPSSEYRLALWENWATHPDPGDDFAGCAVYL